MWLDKETDKDLLGYQVHADLLQNIILDVNMLPISVGVFGDWGAGKSSLMLLLKNNIESQKQQWEKRNKELGTQENTRILQISFNSWQFETYEDTKLTLMETMLGAVVSDINDNKSLFDKADEFIKRLNYLKIGVLILKKVYKHYVPKNIQEFLPSLEELKGSFDENAVTSLLNKITTAHSSDFLAKFRSNLEEIITAAKYRVIVVYVDDLDRCAPERIVECMEAIKLFLNVNNTAFVIGADERVLEYAINQHYPTNQQEKDSFRVFSDYLEKMIQLPYKLPKLSFGEQETYILLLLCLHELNPFFTRIHREFLKFRQKDKYAKFGLEKMKQVLPDLDFSPIEKYVCIIPLMQRFLNGNPRQLKRFLNAFDVRLRLAMAANFDDLRPDVLAKLMVLEYNITTQTCFEDLYNRQILNDGYLDGIKEAEDNAKNDKKVSIWGEKWNSPNLIYWLSSEPSLQDVKLQDYFWVSREALKESIPVDEMINSKVRLVFEKLYYGPTSVGIKNILKDECSGLDSSEKIMIIMKLNEKLRVNANDSRIWTILTQDENDVLHISAPEELSNLLQNVEIDKIDPQAAFFFKRFMQKGTINESYINEQIILSKKTKNAITLI